MSSPCSGLSPTPARDGVSRDGTDGPVVMDVPPIARAETGATHRLPSGLADLRWTLDGRERARPEWGLRGDAGPLIDQPPGIALIVDLGSCGAGGAGAGGAVVLTFERHAVAFLLGAGLSRRGDRGGR